MAMIFKDKDLYKLGRLLQKCRNNKNTTYLSHAIDYYDLDYGFSLVYFAAINNKAKKITYLENFFEHATMLMLEHYADELDDIDATDIELKPRSKAAQLRESQDTEATRHDGKHEWSQSMFEGERNGRYK